MSDLLPRRVLAFDPGPTLCGYAIAECVQAMGRPHFIAGGRVGSDHRALGDLIAQSLAPERWRLTVAVELPGSYLHDPRRASAVLATKGIAERIATICEERELPRISLVVQAWRRRLCAGVSGTPGDDHVKTMLGMLVTGLPKRTNEHVRDALGLACVVLLGTPVAPPQTPAAAVIPPPWRPKRRGCRR